MAFTGLYEILRHDVGFAHAIADLAVVAAILAGVNAAVRRRRSERPPVD